MRLSKIMSSQNSARFAFGRKLLGLACCCLLAAPVLAGNPPFMLSDATHIFSFGDSYTANGYEPSVNFSDVSTMITTSGGPTWIEFLATSNPGTKSTYYNFASLGATVSNSVLPNNGAVDFAGQVGQFMQYFSSGTSSASWTSSNSIFSVWFGSDDIYECFANNLDFLTLQPYILTSLDDQVLSLYTAGARNFLLMDIPALYRTPFATVYGSSGIYAAIEFWNARISVYAQLFTQKYPDAKIAFFSSEVLFNTILDSPSKYGFQNNATACAGYVQAVNEPGLALTSCQFPLSQYFWKDPWRPTWPVHKLLSEDLKSVLTSNTTSVPTNNIAAKASTVSVDVTGSSALTNVLPTAASGVTVGGSTPSAVSFPGAASSAPSSSPSGALSSNSVSAGVKTVCLVQSVHFLCGALGLYLLKSISGF